VALRATGDVPGYLGRFINFKSVEKLEVRLPFVTDGEGVHKANIDHYNSAVVKINSEGFRGEEFKPDTSEKLSILFLGDSFTWGASAKPLTKSFVDIISGSGLITYNTGIPGTSPNQYAYLGEKYSPRLKPDIVAVMLYMGNDLAPPSPMLPDKNILHYTNAGSFYAFDDDGKYMSPEQSYRYYSNKSNLVFMDASDEGIFRSVLRRTVVGTYALASLSVFSSRIKPVLFKGERKKALEKRAKLDRLIADDLMRIKKAAESSGARFMLFLIPVSPNMLVLDKYGIEENMHIFKGLDPYFPSNLTKADYMESPNDHLNNEGHKKYADFILKSITAKPGE
jgi:hypothetical protein